MWKLRPVNFYGDDASNAQADCIRIRCSWLCPGMGGSRKGLSSSSIFDGIGEGLPLPFTQITIDKRNPPTTKYPKRLQPSLDQGSGGFLVPVDIHSNASPLKVQNNGEEPITKPQSIGFPIGQREPPSPLRGQPFDGISEYVPNCNYSWLQPSCRTRQPNRDEAEEYPAVASPFRVNPSISKRFVARAIGA